MADRNFKNRTLYHGDNLDFLRGMNSETVNLIATDPPFNKSRDFHATPDSLASGARFEDRWSWHDDIHDDWLIEIQRDEPEVWQVITSAKAVWGDDMAAFLCWLGVRVLEMHRVLAEDGSLYLHIDHTAHAYVKTLLDAIFGRRHFRNEIVWCYRGAGYPKTDFGRRHDTLSRYSKSDQYTFNLDDVREPYAEATIDRFAHYIGNRRKTGDYGLQTLHPLGKHPDDWWQIQPIAPSAKERVGFPTQKPLALYERIIKASSNPGDMVLDPFCGCATTPVAAERLGREWVGMAIWDGAHQMVLDRLEKEGLAVKNRRVRRRGQGSLVTFGDITYSRTPPMRTDGGEVATLLLETPQSYASQNFTRPREQHGRLLDDLGPYCQGCGADYTFDTRVLEVDHINPRSQGGTDSYDNLTLLCPPCNKEKRDRYTLIGLQQANRTGGWMKSEDNLRMGRASGRSRSRRR